MELLFGPNILTMIDKKDLKDLDALMSLMKVISKHKKDINYQEIYKNKPMKEKNEIEKAQGDLSKVFRFITELKIKNGRLLLIHQRFINDAHSTCIKLSNEMQNIKQALEYSEKNKK